MNFQEILDEHGVEYKTEGRHTRPGWTQYDCPHCQGVLYAGFNTFGGYAFCWRCGKLNLPKTLSLLIGKPYSECLKLLANVDLAPEPLEYTRTGLVIPKGVGPLLPIHTRYLKSRDFDPDELQALWGIKGIGLSTKLPWRLWIPFEYKHKVVSWTTRSVSNDVTTRYVSASPSEESMNHKKLVFGMDWVKHSTIIVEGPFDAFRIGPGATATLGVGFSRSQVVKFARVPSRTIIFDAENKAQERASRLCEALEGYPGQTYRIEIDAKDPGSLSKRDVQILRKQFLKG